MSSATYFRESVQNKPTMAGYFIHQTVVFLMFKEKCVCHVLQKYVHTLSEGAKNKTAAHVIDNGLLFLGSTV